MNFTNPHPLFNESVPRAYDDLKPRQQDFVKMLYDDGARGDVVRRAVVKSVHAQYPDFPWPSWLTGDKTRRATRGVFYLPELAEYGNNIVDEPAPTAAEPELEMAHV